MFSCRQDDFDLCAACHVLQATPVAAGAPPAAGRLVAAALLADASLPELPALLEATHLPTPRVAHVHPLSMLSPVQAAKLLRGMPPRSPDRLAMAVEWGRHSGGYGRAAARVRAPRPSPPRGPARAGLCGY